MFKHSLAWGLLALLAASPLAHPAVQESSTRMGERRQASKAFEAWFKARGGRLHRNVRIAAEAGDALWTGPRGVRLITRGRVPKGHSLVSVPEALLIHAPEDMPCAATFTPMQRLALHLLGVQQSEEAQQRYEEYLGILPQAPFPTALYFTSEDLDNLSGTQASFLAQQKRQRFHAFVDAVRACSDERISSHSMESLKWAVTIAESRSLRVLKPKNPGHYLHDKPFLAPGADLMNHSPTAAVGWRVGSPATHGALDVVTHQGYPRAGMEVFNQYANLNNAQLLTTFGFVLPKNPHNSVPVHLAHGGHLLPWKPLEEHMSTTMLAEQALAIRSTLLAQLRESKQHGAEQVSAGGRVSTSLLNVARVLSLEPRDLTGPGLALLLSINAGPGSIVAPYCAEKLLLPTLGELNSAAQRRMRVSTKKFMQRASAAHPAHRAGLNEVMSFLPPAHGTINVPPRVEVAACELLRAELSARVTGSQTALATMRGDASVVRADLAQQLRNEEAALLQQAGERLLAVLSSGLLHVAQEQFTLDALSNVLGGTQG